MILPTGVYEHYKGKRYLVLGIARHSETQEHLVVYVPLYDTGPVNMAVRPLEMFTGTVRVGGVFHGEDVPRFRFVGGIEG